ncbi:MAG TPA: DUF4350 domain-containing protein, partial [Chryseolinea sp.]|nr:DUF4350 domain-containing protein [Chryseolinea sp.]
MRKDWRYILYISLAFGMFIVLKLLSPKQHNWTVTFGAEDKNPYGGYALNNLIRTSFPNESFRHSFKTLYELKDSLKQGDNIFIVCANFGSGKEDTKILLDHVSNGGAAFLSAQYFSGELADTLQVEAYDYLFNTNDILQKKDSGNLRFSSAAFDTIRSYQYRRDNIHNYFRKFDESRTTVIARNENNQPVTIRITWGKGNIFLNTTPMIFTNIYLLSRDNHEFVSSTLSYLPLVATHWTEFYQRGRMEIQTPLRFVLLNEPLRWAYYISI